MCGYDFETEKNPEPPLAIKRCFKAGKNATEAFEMLRVAYGESVMSRASVFRWYSQVSSGRESIEVEVRSGDLALRKTSLSSQLCEHRVNKLQVSFLELTGIS